MFRRRHPEPEIVTYGDLARAFRPILIHQGTKLLLLWLFQRALLRNLERQLAEQKKV